MPFGENSTADGFASVEPGLALKSVPDRCAADAPAEVERALDLGRVDAIVDTVAIAEEQGYCSRYGSGLGRSAVSCRPYRPIPSSLFTKFCEPELPKPFDVAERVADVPVLLPGPPTRMSLPARPLSTSAPARPRIRSSVAVPFSTCWFNGAAPWGAKPLSLYGVPTMTFSAPPSANSTFSMLRSRSVPSSEFSMAWVTMTWPSAVAEKAYSPRAPWKTAVSDRRRRSRRP